jgi:hypothetical protein
MGGEREEREKIGRVRRRSERAGKVPRKVSPPQAKHHPRREQVDGVEMAAARSRRTAARCAQLGLDWTGLDWIRSAAGSVGLVGCCCSFGYGNFGGE